MLTLIHQPLPLHLESIPRQALPQAYAGRASPSHLSIASWPAVWVADLPARCFVCKMHFGQQLKRSIYPPWKDHYIDYAKLKELLRETDGPHEETSDDWTEEDEGAFVNELVNVQLDKVNDFQVDTSKQLRERTSKGESELEELVASDEKARQDGGDKKLSDHDRQEKLQAIQKKLDNITKETNELEKFSRINFTGFLKAAKKHDRKRGLKYRVRPLLQVRLAALPFNSEDYSPLLYRYVDNLSLQVTC